MHINAALALLALSSASSAFSDSSPWILLSTSPFTEVPNANQIQTNTQVLDFTKGVLSECSTNNYLVVSQPGLSATDFRGLDVCALPHLCKIAGDKQMIGKYSVSEVIGDIAGSELSDYIKASCSKKGKTPQIDVVEFSSLPIDGRARALSENDQLLARKLEATNAGESYTVLLYSSPREPTYEADFDDPVRMDLRRNVQHPPVSQRGNRTEWENLPLFEKYQFFTPGIFMAIITTIVLLSILYVGILALGSLEVSYGAFEKDMGPAAQKKNQ